MHAFWLFPFERYNGIPEDQPTNNRSVELQLMRYFQKDNASINLQHEVRSWLAAEHFIDVISDRNDDDGSTEYDGRTKINSWII